MKKIVKIFWNICVVDPEGFVDIGRKVVRYVRIAGQISSRRETSDSDQDDAERFGKKLPNGSHSLMRKFTKIHGNLQILRVKLRNQTCFKERLVTKNWIIWI